MAGPAQAGKAMVTNADRVGQRATAIATAGVVAAHTPDAIWPASPDLPASKPVTGHHAMMRKRAFTRSSPHTKQPAQLHTRPCRPPLCCVRGGTHITRFGASPGSHLGDEDPDHEAVLARLPGGRR
jgi:hypothetical protein